MQTKKGDFVELKYTGYANGEIFDSNIEEDLKKINPKAKPQRTIVVIGQGMVVKGLDKELEDKEIEKNYEVKIESKDGFGPRDRRLIQTIPLSSFKDKNFVPRAGMVLALDNAIVKIIAVSGARIIADFNNPLAGKNLKYKFKIIRQVTDDKEKAEALFTFFFQFIPDFEIKEKIIVKAPKNFKPLINLYKEKFKELLGKELALEEIKTEEKPEEEKSRKKEENSL